MTNGRATLAAALAAALLVLGCGGDDNGDGTGANGGQAAEQDCLERWNGGAQQDLRAKLSLAGAGDEALVGRYSGEEFTAAGEEAPGGTSTDRTVRPGDCVVARRGSLPDEWLVFFLGEGETGSDTWYDISYNISDNRHPLARGEGEGLLTDVVRARPVGIGTDAKLQAP